MVELIRQKFCNGNYLKLHFTEEAWLQKLYIIIIIQGLGQRPVPVQKFNFWTYESIWTVSRTPWRGDQADARFLPTQDNTTQKKRGHTSMPRAGFEPAIPIFELPKTVRVLDRAAIEIGIYICVCVCEQKGNFYNNFNNNFRIKDF
jgi:hypothetical protein